MFDHEFQPGTAGLCGHLDQNNWQCGMEQTASCHQGRGELLLQTQRVLGEVAVERTVQRGRWGNLQDNQHSPEFWVMILTYHFGRAAHTIFNQREAPTEEAELRVGLPGEGMAQLRIELIKVAATVVAWVEAIDRKIEAAEEIAAYERKMKEARDG
jgi:hypothetical protein